MGCLQIWGPHRKNAGRLTFNPLVSIDPWGALMILLFGFGWARPVPVNHISKGEVIQKPEGRYGGYSRGRPYF